MAVELDDGDIFRTFSTPNSTKQGYVLASILASVLLSEVLRVVFCDLEMRIK